MTEAAPSRAADAPPGPPLPAAIVVLEIAIRYERFAEVMADRRRHGAFSILHPPGHRGHRHRVEWDDPEIAEAFIRRGSAKLRRG